MRSLFVYVDIKVKSEKYANTLHLIIQFQQFLKSKMVIVCYFITGIYNSFNVQYFNNSPLDGYVVTVCGSSILIGSDCEYMSSLKSISFW